jgi:hypothetical protein
MVDTRRYLHPAPCTLQPARDCYARWAADDARYGTSGTAGQKFATATDKSESSVAKLSHTTALTHAPFLLSSSHYIRTQWHLKLSTCVSLHAVLWTALNLINLPASASLNAGAKEAVAASSDAAASKPKVSHICYHAVASDNQLTATVSHAACAKTRNRSATSACSSRRQPTRKRTARALSINTGVAWLASDSRYDRCHDLTVDCMMWV